MDKKKFMSINDKSWKVQVDQTKQSAKLVDSSGEEMLYEDFAK